MLIERVAVTGATGFLGGHITTQLLSKGYTVHATVRSGKVNQASYLRSAATEGELRLFEADLTVDGAFDEAFTDCDAVLHVSSPLTMHARNPVKEVIEPAVNGTLNVLRTCLKHGVKKVVLTSSFSAIHCQQPQKVIDGMHTHTEEDWSDEFSENFVPYSYSKMIAEKATWQFVEDHQADNVFELIVINPTILIGPALSEGVSQSVQGILDVIDGKFFGIIDMVLAFVDVRDVAAAHILALENPSARGRFLCCAQDGGQMKMRGLIRMLKEYGFKPPDMDLSHPVVTQMIKLLTRLMDGQMGQFVRHALGQNYRISNRKIREELGCSFRPVEESVKDTLDDLVKWGHTKDPTTQ